MDVCQFLTTLLMVVVSGRPGWSQHTCDSCDCNLSSHDDDRAIFNVKTRCTAGTIKWGSAYGAIRLEFKPWISHDYRLCFVVDSQHTVTQVSQELSQHPRKGNYRLKQPELLQALTLRPMMAAKGQSREYCVWGRTRESVLLFIEVERTSEFTGIPSVTLQFDVEKVSDDVLADPMEECRPCTQEELLESYCTSDFVVVGSMKSVQQHESHDLTHIEVAVAQLIHQNEDLFKRVRRSDPHLTGVIHAPRKCGIKPGDTHLLITGRMRLGQPALRCAPFYDEWLKISLAAECAYD